MFRTLMLVLLLFAVVVVPLAAQDTDPIKVAQALRKDGQPVPPASDTMVIAEAEEFQVTAPGWKAQPWGSNYFCATFANSFLSRKGFLGAPEQGDTSTATLTVQVPKAGRYLALVRYEAVYRFETQFRLKVTQAGKDKLDRLYGARDNLKVWAFSQKLKKEIAWDWGAVENVVWEGHDAFVDLDAGPATLTLTAGKQPGLGARRNVDVIVLTSDVQDVQTRIDKEGYLPLDGLLTQAGDLHLKLHNKSDGPLTLTVPNGTEHSPYWVHMRTWKPKTVTAAAGQASEWVEVGSLLDSLNDGQWALTSSEPGARFDLEFGVRGADGKVETIRKLEGLTGNVELAYDADTRYTRRIRPVEDVLYDLVAYLKKQPITGTPPKRTLIYGYSFEPKPGNDKYNAAVAEFKKLSGATALVNNLTQAVDKDTGLIRGYIDLRDIPTPKLEEHCQKLKADGVADKIAVVSLGDEIGLAPPPANDHANFRTWLQTQKLKPSDVDPAADTWDKITFNPDSKLATTKPGLFYWSRIYSFRHGIRQLKERTDILKKYLPNAGVGANFSPHHKYLYLGDTYHWISVFRDGGMSMPWGEDYIWQVPVGTQQMNFLMLDMFRCGIKNHPEAKVHYYIMPHTPGNTPASWRRQFYGDLGHGAKVLNLFEYRPVQAAYTENHCSDPAMYKACRVAFHELAKFEDVIQDGRVRPATAGLWFSETADVWDDYAHSLGAGKRSLYVAVRHQQVPLDCVLDGDDLKPYKVLYLTDRHVSRAGSNAIVEWVKAGGRLFATAGAGMYDELNQPNKLLRQLLGADETSFDPAKEVISREKEHLPFAEPVDTVKLRTNATEVKVPVLGARSRFKAATDAHIMADFADGSPAMVMRGEGQGHVYYCGFLPGLAYFKPAIPQRPVDRGATDDTMAHFIPTEFDRGAAMLIATSAEEIARPVQCSEPLVETTVLEAKSGVVIPLVNWSKGPIKGLTVTLTFDAPEARVELASGKPVKMSGEKGKRVFTLDLDVADALILR